MKKLVLATFLIGPALPATSQEVTQAAPPVVIEDTAAPVGPSAATFVLPVLLLLLVASGSS